MTNHSYSGHYPLETVQFPIQPIMARDPRFSAATAAIRRPTTREQWPSGRLENSTVSQGGLHPFGATRSGNNIKSALDQYQMGNYLAAMKICRVSA